MFSTPYIISPTNRPAGYHKSTLLCCTCCAALATGKNVLSMKKDGIKVLLALEPVSKCSRVA